MTDKNCVLYSYEGENWPKVAALSETAVGDWFLYLDDMYFGKVVGKDERQLTLLVTNFRVESASYRAKFAASQLHKLRQKPTEVLVDPEIAAEFPTLHRALVRAFAVWKEMDGLVMEAAQSIDRQRITPQIFRQCGRMFGKWAASGYMLRQDLKLLAERGFAEEICDWHSLQDLALRDDVGEEVLATLDRIRAMPLAEFAEQNVDVDLWIAIQAGFFAYTEENCVRLRKALC